MASGGSRFLPGLLLLLLAGCGAVAEEPAGDAAGDPAGGAKPTLGECRALTAEDIAAPTDTTEPVECSEEHTAQTFTVGTFPDRLAASDAPDDPRLGAYVFDTCTERFAAFTGGDESAVLRSLLGWAWFRPTDDAWDAGARWYRCDVVGGGEHTDALRPLPDDARGVLGAGAPDDAWMACARGETVAGSPKVPCTEPHTWRAVSTIKVGAEEDAYPGDRTVEVTTRDYCSDSVGAWLNYPVDYDYGYTWFHQAEWKVGNRRSICWARTRD
jgi:hypothetical protein